MRKRFLMVLGVIGVCVSITTLAISQMDRKTKDDLFSQIEIFSYALTTIQSEYVDEKSPKDLIYGSLKGMLSTLDPHSQFLDPKEYNELKTETQGKFGGLGIEISIRDGLLTIITPIEDTPAWKAGLKSGDHIVKIENEVTKDMTLSDAVGKLRGKPGTDVNITILREDEYKIMDFTITREIIHVQDVKNTQVLEDKIGYIRLTEFREDSAGEFRKGLEQLIKDGADSLIVDLRNNPGGLLNVAIKITEEFISEGKVIVSTKGRRPGQETVAKSTNKDHLITWPMVVLINEGSASGSEIFAGALKDHKRAILVGSKSYGKGSVQSVIPLPDGSGLRLTTSKYYTPSGISIHEIGITPDIIVERRVVKEDNEDDKKSGVDIKEKKANIEKVFEDVDAHDGKKDENSKLTKDQAEIKKKLLEDNQIQTALSVLKGIRVYQDLSAAPAVTTDVVTK